MCVDSGEDGDDSSVMRLQRIWRRWWY